MRFFVLFIGLALTVISLMHVSKGCRRTSTVGTGVDLRDCKELMLVVETNTSFAAEIKETSDRCFESLLSMGEKSNQANSILSETRNLGSNFWHSIGVESSQTNAILADPFHCQQFHRVEFSFTCDADVVIGWCAKQMQRQGWVVVREILPTEYTNSNGDWVRVYRRGNALVRIHVFGVFSHLTEEKKQSGWLIEHQIFFDLLQTSPKEFFNNLPSLPPLQDEGRNER